MTRADHPCGTDRIHEAALKLHLAEGDVVVNVQGDEPDMPAACVDKLIALLEDCDAPLATLATPLPAAQAEDPNKVKVVLDGRGRALYFSRSRIPFDRDRSGQVGYLLHLGIYAYRVGFLKTFAGLAPTAAERAEKLEQLRALEHGYAIAVAVVDYHGVGIDTPADYAAFVARASRP
jgi:3-deoxy-manno-octulosonate cytidylyltransferase (CMP-KDO synthetase)